MYAETYMVTTPPEGIPDATGHDNTRGFARDATGNHNTNSFSERPMIARAREDSQICYWSLQHGSAFQRQMINKLREDLPEMHLIITTRNSFPKGQMINKTREAFPQMQLVITTRNSFSERDMIIQIPEAYLETQLVITTRETSFSRDKIDPHFRRVRAEDIPEYHTSTTKASSGSTLAKR